MWGGDGGLRGEPSSVERFSVTGWICSGVRCGVNTAIRTVRWWNEGTHEIVLEANTLMEEELLDAEGGCLQGIIYGPERSARGVANPGCAMAGDTVRLAGIALQHAALACKTFPSNRRTQGYMSDRGCTSPRCPLRRLTSYLAHTACS